MINSTFPAQECENVPISIVFVNALNVIEERPTYVEIYAVYT